MGATERALVIALRVDNSQYAPGLNQGLVQTRQFVRQAGQINREMQAEYSSHMIMDSLGGKKIVKQQLKYMAAEVAGLHGGPVGMAIASGLALSLPVAAITSGIILIGETFSAAAEAATAFAEESKAFAKTVEESRKFWRDLDKTPTTPRGQSAETQADKIDARLKELDDAYTEALKKNNPLSWSGWAGMAQEAFTGTNSGADLLKKIREEQAFLKGERAKLSGVTNEEAGKYAQGIAEHGADRLAQARLTVMDPGPDRERAELLERQTREIREQEEAAANHKETISKVDLLESHRLETMALEGKLAREQAKKDEELKKSYQAEFRSLVAERDTANNPTMKDAFEEQQKRRELEAKGYSKDQQNEIIRLTREVNGAKLLSKAKEEVKGLKEELKTPDELLADYRTKLDTYGDQHVLDPQTEARLLQKKLKEMSPVQHAGEFTDADSRSRDIQSALLNKDDTPKLSLKAQQDMAGYIATLLRDGIKMRGN